MPDLPDNAQHGDDERRLAAVVGNREPVAQPREHRDERRGNGHRTPLRSSEMTATESGPSDDRATPAIARVDQIVRITLRPIGSPMPLGFFAVAIATALSSSLQLGLVQSKGAAAIGLLIAPAFVLQLVVTIFALLARDPMAATLMGTLSGSWLVDSLTLTMHPTDAKQALSVFFFVLTAFVAMMAYAARPKTALYVVLTVAIPRFFFAGLAAATGSVAIERVAGGLGFALAAAALYAAFALMLEDMQGHTVLPIGRRGPALAALEGQVADQLVGLEHNAGVRRTL